VSRRPPTLTLLYGGVLSDKMPFFWRIDFPTTSFFFYFICSCRDLGLTGINPGVDYNFSMSYWVVFKDKKGLKKQNKIHQLFNHSVLHATNTNFFL